MFKTLITIALLSIATTTFAGEAEAVRDTNWCFQGDTSDTLTDQAGRSGTCAALLTGGLAAAWFGAIDPGIIGSVLTEPQNRLAERAADASCMKNGATDQVAVRLIQVCNCHNDAAVTNIEHNQTQVIQTLRQRRGC